MRLDDEIIGSLNLYSTEPRRWSDTDIAAAGVLADMATSYVVNASMLRQKEQLREQLPAALESGDLIDQAKGITAQQHSFTVDQAAQQMRRHALDNNASLRAVADAIVAVGLKV
jgi:AmiR/NasT family two-component response regulator